MPDQIARTYPDRSGSFEIHRAFGWEGTAWVKCTYKDDDGSKGRCGQMTVARARDEQVFGASCPAGDPGAVANDFD
jgi:hypothetical protein